jgi:hypothetical protein
VAVDKEHSAPAGSEEQASEEASSEEQASGVPRWLVGTAALALSVVAIVIVYGYLARPRPEWIGVANKNVWDWLDLLVVPAALAIGVYWLNTRQAVRQQQAEDQRPAREEAAQAAQAQQALDVEDQRAQDAALQAYLDQMSHLLTDAKRPLRRAQPSDDLSIVARARTLTVLPRLDGERKARVVQFLYEAGLVSNTHPVLALGGANLSGAYLRGAYLRGADLYGAEFVAQAYLSGAILSNAFDLARTAANLSNANLSNANLSNANLSGAILSEAQGWTEDQLREASSLEEATMPNGQKYEDWLKDREGHKEDVENSGPS